MSDMVAKFQVSNITEHSPQFHELEFQAVSEKPFDADGASDDNSFARWTPSGSLKIGINNPDLLGKFQRGEKYYLNFTKAAALLVTTILLFCSSAQAQTNTTSTNILNKLGSVIADSGILQATNYSFDPYVTYAPSAKEKFGGGFLAIYNVNNYAGLALGGDYLGEFTMVSANLTLKLPINIGSYLPSSWTWASNVVVTPFALVGTGAPLGGSGSSGVIAIEDAGLATEFGHLWGGRFNAGASYGQWQNAGAYSGVRYHVFFGWSHGF